MDSMIRDFALQILRRLQKRPPKGAKSTTANGSEEDQNMEDGQIPPEELIQTPYLSEEIDLPVVKSLVLQHVELLFALSVKIPEFLDEYISPFFPLLVYQTLIYFQDICGLWADGHFRPRSHSRLDHCPCEIFGIEQWQITYPHADLPFRF